MKKYRLFIWPASCVGMVILSIIAFSPLVIPPGKYLPTLFGLPYSLWTGIAITLSMMILTVLAALVVSDLSDGEEL